MSEDVTYMHKHVWALLLFLLVGSRLSTTNCVKRVPPQQKEIEQPVQPLPEEAELSERKKIISRALEMEALKPKPDYNKLRTLKNPITGEPETCMFDCSGFVLKVYKFANINFFEEQKGKIAEKNGVKFIHKALKNSNKIYHKKIPNIADIVFFNNTWDSNGDKKINDELTHVGIVLTVDKYGTITFIHSSVSGGVTKDFMNLCHPNEKAFNSNVRERRKDDPDNTKYSANELINAFGTVFDVPQGGDDF